MDAECSAFIYLFSLGLHFALSSFRTSVLTQSAKGVNPLAAAEITRGSHGPEVQGEANEETVSKGRKLDKRDLR